MKVEVSICIITYNHAPFIKDTLASVNAQQFNEQTEIIIGVDKSDDDTLSIVKEWIKESRWPVKLLEYEQRQGMFGNLYNVLQKAEGTYVAMLEGDDYWIDPGKTAKQYTYMQHHNNCVATGGGIKILRGTVFEKGGNITTRLSQYYYLNDVAHANRFAFCTLMFRRDNMPMVLFEKLKDSPHLDWPIYLTLLSGNSKNYIKVFKDIFSVYRIHTGGVYSGVDQAKRTQNVLKTLTVNSTILPSGYSAYYSLYKEFLSSQLTGLIPVDDLIRKHKLHKHQLLSFYMQVYGKKNIPKILRSNSLHIPLLAWLLIKKMHKRYISGLFF